MESTPDHRWLMQYNIVNLVNQCRRLIRAEFDENLSLTDPQLRFKLAHFAGRTCSQGLQRLYGEIRLALLKLEGADPEPQQPPAPVVRRYRGQAISPAPEEPPRQTATRSRSTQKAVIYRGRTVAQG
ncbi:hypothetical protein F1529_07160 [Alcanivorax sp. VBW004]|uniref:hypothetical protein n=1 Tax=Alcanivorax sp. VBW004 TaxID=1287708 RepID=UPI0012BB9CAB|nr:hypothetical protein [Alcanivorax sp. VBW004]MTT52259.1 hypothetical protein [Alcanivorax sp. VBW004]